MDSLDFRIIMTSEITEYKDSVFKARVTYQRNEIKLIFNVKFKVLVQNIISYLIKMCIQDFNINCLTF